MNDRPTLATMVIGAVIFTVVTAAWLAAEFNHIGTGALLAFAVPVVGALFIGQQLGAARDAAQQAANQTNGALDARIKAGVSAGIAEQLPAIEAAAAAANAKRDAARTRQHQGDISQADQAAQAVAARNSDTSSAT